MNLAGVAEQRVKEQGEQPSLLYEGRGITNVEMVRGLPGGWRGPSRIWA